MSTTGMQHCRQIECSLTEFQAASMPAALLAACLKKLFAPALYAEKQTPVIGMHMCHSLKRVLPPGRMYDTPSVKQPLMNISFLTFLTH